MITYKSTSPLDWPNGLTGVFSDLCKILTSTKSTPFLNWTHPKRINTSSYTNKRLMVVGNGELVNNKNITKPNNAI